MRHRDGIEAIVISDVDLAILDGAILTGCV